VRLALGVTVLATATACGEKKVDPYANSLAQGSEHVELHGTVHGARVTGSGDFRGDRGTLTTHVGRTTLHEVIVGHRTYVRTIEGWRSTVTRGANTPAELFRRRLPATIENGLVRRMVVGPLTYEFSRYGEQVSVTVPTKGSK
jgi:hypothetical protein